MQTNQYIKVPSTGKIKSVEMLHKPHKRKFDVFDSSHTCLTFT